MPGGVRRCNGVKCTTSKIKFELVDQNGNKSGIYLDGISATTEKYYTIALNQLIGSADKSKIAYVYFVVEGDNKVGTLEVNHLKVATSITSDPAATINNLNLPTVDLTDPGVMSVKDLDSVVANIATTARGLTPTQQG